MKRDSIVMFRSQIEALLTLTSLSDVKTILSTILEYGMNGNTEVKVPSHLQFGWTMIKNQIDMVKASYEEKSAKCREAASKRWEQQTDTDAYKRMQTDTNGCHNDNVNDNVFKDNKNIIAHTHEENREFPGYPQTAKEIVAIGKRHGFIIKEDIAQQYLDDRMRKGWTPTGSHKMTPLSGIPGDIRTWLNRSDNATREKQQRKNNNATNNDIAEGIDF